MSKTQETRTPRETEPLPKTVKPALLFLLFLRLFLAHHLLHQLHHLLMLGLQHFHLFGHHRLHHQLLLRKILLLNL